MSKVTLSSKALRRRTLSYSTKEEHSEDERKELLTRYDKPCHQNADSLFSTSSGFTNYRGILNLGLILLALTCTRIALENVIKYGILINPLTWIQFLLNDPYSWPSFGLFIACMFFTSLAFLIELQLANGALSEKTGFALQWVNILIEITFPAVVILFKHPLPPFSFCTLVISTVMFLKLISYHQVNGWCRAHITNKTQKQKRTRGKSVSDDAVVKNGKASSLQMYPDNVNVRDFIYFLCAPTLCYELNFPRSVRIRKRFLAKRIVEMIFLSGLMLSLIQQWVIPTVQNSIVPFQESNVSKIVERLLKLAVPNLLIWLLFFYWLFHSCLNVFAELLKFGDRVFYRDWWNAETVTYFWKNWNIPVHKWASRHLYKPMLMQGYTKTQANIAVFLFSAFFHEYLVSVPLRMFRLWAFSGLLMQVPLAIIVRQFKDGKWGNIAVWASIIIGQPIAVLMYCHDYYVIHYLLSSPTPA